MERIPVITFNLETNVECLLNSEISQHNWNVIYDVLKNTILEHTRPILCFQSISPSIESRLHSFFNINGYTMITTHYDIKNINYGLGIAFSNQSYRLKEIQTHRMSDVIQELYGKPEYPKDDPLEVRCLQSITRFIDRFLYINSMWERAIKYKHRILGVQLQHKDKSKKDPFWIWTCDFPTDPDVNMVYTMTMIRIVSTRKRIFPFILAGCFNFDHDSTTYRMVQGDNMTKDILVKEFNIEPQPFTMKKFDPILDTHCLSDTFKMFNHNMINDHENINECGNNYSITRIQNIKNIGIVKETTDYIFIKSVHKVLYYQTIDIFDHDKFDSLHQLIHLPIKSVIVF